jgi:hypothetical protein
MQEYRSGKIDAIFWGRTNGISFLDVYLPLLCDAIQASINTVRPDKQIHGVAKQGEG